jgi:hypothetical protein
MLQPDRLLRLAIELVFVLLGGIIVWLGLTQQVFFNPQKWSWLVLSVALVVWGVRAIAKPSRSWAPWEHWMRGLSLVLLGIVMFAISRATLQWVGRLLAIAGLILILRGLVACALLARPR